MPAEWNPLTSFAMLVVNNNRSKCYLQNLMRAGYRPAHVLVLDAGTQKLAEHTANDARSADSKPTEQTFNRGISELGVVFDEKKNVLATLVDESIPHTVLPTVDVNSELVVAAVSAMGEPYVVFSGPGGTILRDQILGTGSHFLHVHPGWLPTYRGSTTVYYSMLLGEPVGASVIALTSDLDGGPVFLRRQFEFAELADPDHVVDPCVRTALLVDFFNSTWGRRPEPLAGIDEGDGNTFYIVHPVFKHRAILRWRDREVQP